MGFDAHLWKNPPYPAETPYDFEEVCDWSGRSSYGWMHEWLTSHGTASEHDGTVRLLTARDIVDFHEELVRRYEDCPEEGEDREILRVAGWVEATLAETSDDDRFTYYGSF